MARGDFIGLDTATLNALQSSYTAAITALATGIQSYSIGGRSVTCVQLPDLTATLGEINFAIRQANGTMKKTTFGRYSRVTY